MRTLRDRKENRLMLVSGVASLLYRRPILLSQRRNVGGPEKYRALSDNKQTTAGLRLSTGLESFVTTSGVCSGCVTGSWVEIDA